MKRLAPILFCSLLLLGSCDYFRPAEQRAIIAYMKAHANDPGSYEPVSFRFLGPATHDNLGILPGDSTRAGDLYEHVFRAKNGFGATMLSTQVFAVEYGQASMLPDSLGERALRNFRP